MQSSELIKPLQSSPVNRQQKGPDNEYQETLCLRPSQAVGAQGILVLAVGTSEMARNFGNNSI